MICHWISGTNSKPLLEMVFSGFLATAEHSQYLGTLHVCHYVTFSYAVRLKTAIRI